MKAEQKVTKAQVLQQWKQLKDNLPILPHMEVIPYKAKGSKYGACGIRIDGNSAFIEAVLSRIKDVIDGENAVTRLELSRIAVDGSKLGKSFDNATSESEVCYIRLHQRGGEASHMNLMFDRNLTEATMRFVNQA